MAIVIPYTKQTWTDGSGGGTPVSAARLGVLEEGIRDVSQAPAVRVFNSIAISVANNAITVLGFDSERFDQAGGVASTQHDTVTNNSRLTCLYSGIYIAYGAVEWAGNATGVRTLQIRHQPSGFLYGRIDVNAPGTATMSMQISSLPMSLVVNDYIELLAYQNSGGALNANASPRYAPEFGMVRIA